MNPGGLNYFGHSVSIQSIPNIYDRSRLLHPACSLNRNPHPPTKYKRSRDKPYLIFRIGFWPRYSQLTRSKPAPRCLAVVRPQLNSMRTCAANVPVEARCGGQLHGATCARLMNSQLVSVFRYQLCRGFYTIVLSADCPDLRRMASAVWLLVRTRSGTEAGICQSINRP